MHPSSAATSADAAPAPSKLQALGTNHWLPDTEHQAPDEQTPAPAPARRQGFVERASGKVVRRVAIYLEPKTYEALKRYCDETLTMSDLSAQAVRDFLTARAPSKR